MTEFSSLVFFEGSRSQAVWGAVFVPFHCLHMFCEASTTSTEPQWLATSSEARMLANLIRPAGLASRFHPTTFFVTIGPTEDINCLELMEQTVEVV